MGILSWSRHAEAGADRGDMEETRRRHGGDMEEGEEVGDRKTKETGDGEEGRRGVG